MTPASKGAQVKRVPASRSGSSGSSRDGNKSSSAKVAATATKRPALTKKKAAPVVKKAAIATKKVAPPAKKAAPSAAKKALTATAKKVAPAKKATPAPRKTAPAAKKVAPPPKKGTAAAASASAKKTAGKTAEKAPAKKAASAAAGAAALAAAAPARTTFTPKPKPPAPVRPKTGPYAKDVKFLEEVRELLVADRAIYQEQATSLRAEADSLALEREPGDVQFDEESGEGGTVTVDRERNLALSGQAVLAVEEIDDALRRIEDKTYGYCERCFQPIPKPRLRALPYARLCVACKSGGLSRR
jgi:RNA polymerase-binding transcription factor DksA